MTRFAAPEYNKDMKKPKISFVCQECGYDSASWYGKCPECGAWNSFKEIKEMPTSRTSTQWALSFTQEISAQTLEKIAYKDKSRIVTNFEELNTVLGGGVVLGSVSL